MQPLHSVPKNATITQCTNTLIDTNGRKCAMGVLSCALNSEKYTLVVEKMLDDTYNLDFLNSILGEYGINNDDVLPYLGRFGGFDFDCESYMRLTNIIVSLNDYYNLTFKQIGEFLEVTFDL